MRGWLALVVADHDFEEICLPLDTDEFYERIATVFGYEYRNYLLGIFVEYEARPRVLVRRYMTGQFGRAWWAVRRESMPEAARLVVDDEMSKTASANLDFQLELKLIEEIEKN